LRGKFFSGSKYASNVLTLVSGTAFAQVLPLAISPILTRMFRPEDFGVFSLYFGILTVLSVFATAKYELAIILPADEKEAKNIFDLSLLIALVTSSFAFIILWIFKNDILRMLKAESLDGQLMLVPLGLLFVGVSQSLYYYLNRGQYFKTMALVRIFRSAGYVASALLGGVLKFSATLISADVFGYFTSVLFGWKAIVGRKGNFSSSAEMITVAKRYINFPRYLIVSGFFEKGSGQAPVFLLTNLFHSVTGAGFFSFAQRIIIAPADLLSRAIGDIFRQQASTQFSVSGRCDALFRKTFLRLTFIGVVPFVMAFFLVEDVFAFIFGQDWREAGVYAKIMMPMFFLQFVISPLSSMFIIAHQQRYDLTLQILLFIGVVLSFYIGNVYDQDTQSVLKVFTAVYCLKYIAELALSYKFSLGDAKP
jgi:O-antigen/teichoic acid export membrane protein